MTRATDVPEPKLKNQDAGIQSTSWNRVLRVLSAVLLISFVSSACQLFGQEDEQADVGTFDSVLSGTVLSADGSPIDEAIINGRLYFEDCADTTGAVSIRDYAEGGDITASNGVYSIRFQQPEYQPTACMNIKVYLEPGEAADKDTTVYPDVELRPASDPIDTTRVDLVVRP